MAGILNRKRRTGEPNSPILSWIWSKGKACRWSPSTLIFPVQSSPSRETRHYGRLLSNFPPRETQRFGKLVRPYLWQLRRHWRRHWDSEIFPFHLLLYVQLWSGEPKEKKTRVGRGGWRIILFAPFASLPPPTPSPSPRSGKNLSWSSICGVSRHATGERC